MSRRDIPVADKAQALREVLYLREKDAEEIALKYGVSSRSVYNWFRRVLDALPDTLAARRPKRTRKPRAATLRGGHDETIEGS